MTNAHTAGQATSSRSAPVLAVHGGAGVIERSQMTQETERAYREGIAAALQAGHHILARGGSSIDAVVAAVSAFEDNPLFNAGRGAVFTAEGRNELDAAVMDGATLEAGAVTLVTTVKNPVQLARLVMDKTRHVMLAGEGAEALARKHHLATVAPEYFRTERRWQALERVRGAGANARVALTESDKHGTVGAVALDAHGNLAAATSTGGRNNKLAGRVGDSPLVGAGTYAANATAAVSCTGEGEYFMRIVAAHTLAALIEMKGLSVEQAAHEVIHARLLRAGGRGGLIALDAHGRVAMPFSTPGMYRGVVRPDGVPAIGIFAE
jgi:L-asparaginase / beta-aspartyl-peptidase